MGLDGATKTKWVGKGLPLKAIDKLQLGKRIDVDGNALAWMYCQQKGNKSLPEILTLMAQWFEEWFLYFEVLWLRSHTRWEDLAVMYNKSSTQTLRKVFDSKTQIVLACRKSWPTYVSFEEDKNFLSQNGMQDMATKELYSGMTQMFH